MKQKLLGQVGYEAWLKSVSFKGYCVTAWEDLPEHAKVDQHNQADAIIREYLKRQKQKKVKHEKHTA